MTLEKTMSVAEPNSADMQKQMANAIRTLSMDAVEKAKSGHPGMPMGMADVATVLFSQFLKFSPQNPKWADRDRFILSTGHGSMLLYSLFYLTGYPDITIEDIKNFRQLHAKTAGHPEYGVLEGIETTTGPLGQGLANAVGFAIAEKISAERYGSDITNHNTYTIVGDGCLMEGISQESISLAGHLKLSKLIVLFDDNGISIDGPTSLTTSEDHIKRFESCGWDAQSVDGHNMQEVAAAIAKAKSTNKPSLIACKTTIAFGSPNKGGTSSSHGSPLGKDEIAKTREQLGWTHAPFEVPEGILNAWRKSAQNSSSEFVAWNERFTALDADKKAEFTRTEKGELPAGLDAAFDDLKKKYASEKPSWATRKSSGEVLKDIVQIVPEMIGGSADLTGSNLTKTDDLKPINADDFSGRYMYYGIREHAMGAIMNGMVLHGGIIPFGGTFLVFSDYCRPAIRLSALMRQRVVYVMTHDSIGLGEDGPTHQPVEHLAALRAIPNLHVFRPADACETAECWQIALKSENTPSLLALTRQNLPEIREYSAENKSARGAYIISEAASDVAVTIFATGSEVSLALESQKTLQEKGIGTRVVSVPCAEMFFAQDSEYKVNLLCNSSIKVAVEAASKMGWERFIGGHGIFIGMNGFGESAPADELYKLFGITAENLVEKV
jgi:transketolase